MSTDNATFQTGLSGMTKITVLGGPGYFTVVTHAAKLARAYIIHGDIIGAGAHFETEFMMTNLASKPDAVKPVRKDYRPHPTSFGPLV